ncbi:MAG TPA: hypothetical protein DEB24_07410 [Coriobacteriia bacterium]|nr:hypothetical protein [Coriobacteriia bacterium]
MTFAQNLIYIRQHHGVTQETLAEQIGVSRQTISKWESGINFPETDKLLLLCDLYNTHLDDLMRGSVEVGSPATRGDKRNRLMAVSCGIIMLLATLVYLLFGYLGGSMPFSGAGFSRVGLCTAG